MYSLILDSTNVKLNVGLAKDNVLIDEISYECWQKQSEMMIPEIKKILENNIVSPKDINEILVTIGPGSYTGVRIALTIAKVYAYCLNIPCYFFSSLMVLENYNKKSICVINARSNRSYFGVYDKNKVLVSDTIKTNDEVINYINNHQDYAVCGDTDYLNIDGENNSVSSNMILLKDNSHLVKDIMSLKAIYLKD